VVVEGQECPRAGPVFAQSMIDSGDALRAYCAEEAQTGCV